MELCDVKYGGDVVPPKMLLHKEKMKGHIAEAFAQQSTLDDEVKVILGEDGTPIKDNLSYLAFAREMGRITKRFSGAQLTGEVSIVTAKWTARGLAPATLKRITALFTQK
jgi:hypothetical protein